MEEDDKVVKDDAEDVEQAADAAVLASTKGAVCVFWRERRIFNESRRLKHVRILVNLL